MALSNSYYVMFMPYSLSNSCLSSFGGSLPKPCSSTWPYWVISNGSSFSLFSLNSQTFSSFSSSSMYCQFGWSYDSSMTSWIHSFFLHFCHVKSEGSSQSSLIFLFLAHRIIDEFTLYVCCVSRSFFDVYENMWPLFLSLILMLHLLKIDTV